MSLPTKSQGLNGAPTAQRVQPSIRSFFQPKQPVYAATPSVSRSVQAQSQREDTQPQQEDTRPPEAPPLPPQSRANEAITPTTAACLPMPLPMPTHHPNITISPILPSHIPSLRRIVSRLLPVRYPDSFYAALSNPQSSGAFSRVLLWTDSSSSPSKPTVIGGLICRPERTFQARPSSARDVIPDALYIQSLVLNEPYQHLGLAACLLDEVCRLAWADDRFRCRTVCAHVWTDNAEGLAWYAARGFETVRPIVAKYYRQLSPSDAWIVRREMMPSLQAVMVSSASQASSARPSPSPLLSYQNTRPETEWNDLPAEMSTTTRSLTVPSGASSGASSRSSSAVRKKRAYPAAAFGN